jgi:uncharacterized protein YcfL
MKSHAPLFLLLLAAAGCAQPVNNSQTLPPASPPPAQQSAAPDKRIVINPSLQRFIQVVKTTSATGPEGYLKIQLDVLNRSDTPHQFRYSIDWLDGDGAELPLAANGFLDWMLLAHETSSIAATAPSPAAKDFRVTFRGVGQ